MTVSDRFGEITEQGTQDVADQSLTTDFNHLAFDSAPKHHSVSGKHPKSQLNTHANRKMLGINNTAMTNQQ